MKFLLTISFTLLMAMLNVEAQVIYDYGFKRDLSVNVADVNNLPLGNAWAGGLNSCHFSGIDLNLDGIPDLISFDKSGSKLLTFINNGLADSICYTFAPYYRKFFPELYGWVKIIDYNGDQKNDIFTYTSGGIKVYKNISDTCLKFQMQYAILNSNMGSIISNIGLTYDDFPAIYDIDGDGDLDILTFFGLGTFIEMHKNLSQELYGNNDTLIYELSSHCWGDFSESSVNNVLNLNVSCPWRDDSVDFSKSTRHTGSTMLAGDFNNDGLTDLILGDVDYFNLIKLTNGGTSDSAHMISQDTLFPSNSTPVNFNSFPVPSLIDLNNDGKKDMLVSPFSTVTALTENKQSVWYYENTGTNTAPVFNFIEPDFLQSEMIETGSGCYPVIYDYNSDGLKDIMLGNYGYLDSSYYEFGYLKSVFRSQIAVLENTGTITNPVFKITDYDFAGLSQLNLINLVPTFGDLDDDGDIDMICGQSNGTLIYFENTAGEGNLPVYASPVFNYQSVDVGDFSFPQLFDLNNDSLLDLAIGKKNGLISYYQNTGTAINPVFTKITDSLGKVNVTDPVIASYGFSAPCFFTDSNKIKLFSGSDKGDIYYYKNIELNLGGKFTANDSVLIHIDKDSSTIFINDGMRSSAAVYDFNNDGYKDMVCGNFSGGLSFYYGMKPHAYSSVNNYASNLYIPEFRLFPIPALDQITISFNDIINSPVCVEIYDLIGKRIFTEEFPLGSDILKINTSGLKSGFYLSKILIKDTGKKNAYTISRKFIISR